MKREGFNFHEDIYDCHDRLQLTMTVIKITMVTHRYRVFIVTPSNH